MQSDILSKIRRVEYTLSLAVFIFCIAGICLIAFLTLSVWDGVLDLREQKGWALAGVITNLITGAIMFIRWRSLGKDPEVVQALREHNEFMRRIDAA